MSGLVMSALMAVAPALGYLDQYRLIRQQQTSEGFNAITCAILLFSRCVLFVCMDKNSNSRNNTIKASSEKHGRFWQWANFGDYANRLLGFTTLVAVAYKYLGHRVWFVEALGILSLGLESTLPVPQCLSIYQARSAAGFSPLIMASWAFGDGFKLFYFVSTSAPLQFSLCGAVQLSVDMLIVSQAFIYYVWLPRGTKEQAREHLSPYEEIP
ncbi:hypothetical protein BX666DRAFT_1867877 [Dichotomocladium elegans]|nr:hypothetical protein BX666DRAFT_1867877 [Dichotomocladium elegans]